MKFIIDANIVMSALISTKGNTFDLIFNDEITLFAPEFLFEEIKKYEDEILKKSGLQRKDFSQLISLISSKIELIPKLELYDLIEKAEEICPDPNDSEYFALALKMSIPIWSNDKRLKEQNKVDVYSTYDLIKGM